MVKAKASRLHRGRALGGSCRNYAGPSVLAHRRGRGRWRGHEEPRGVRRAREGVDPRLCGVRPGRDGIEVRESEYRLWAKPAACWILGEHTGLFEHESAKRQTGAVIIEMYGGPMGNQRNPGDERDAAGSPGRVAAKRRR